MKKFILFLLTLQLLISATCLAFEQPNPDRWLWLNSNDTNGFWLDRESINSKLDTRYQHKDHLLLECWILSYNVKDDQSSKLLLSLDMECAEFKILHVSVYDKNNKLIGQHTYSYGDYEPIVPETLIESIFEVFKNLLKEQANDYQNSEKDLEEIESNIA